MTFGTGCPTSSIAKQAAGGGQPLPISLDFLHLRNFPGLWSTPGALAGHRAGKAERQEEGNVFGNTVLITLGLYQHVSSSNST